MKNEKSMMLYAYRIAADEKADTFVPALQVSYIDSLAIASNLL